jgi:hypothetical protein
MLQQERQKGALQTADECGPVCPQLAEGAVAETVAFAGSVAVGKEIE